MLRYLLMLSKCLVFKNQHSRVLYDVFIFEDEYIFIYFKAANMGKETRKIIC